MTRKPTFELLREKRKLPVINPDNGTQFTISLWDWKACLWAIRVIPAVPHPSDAHNPYTRGHCLRSRWFIEEWLDKLRLQPAAGRALKTARKTKRRRAMDNG